MSRKQPNPCPDIAKKVRPAPPPAPPAGAKCTCEVNCKGVFRDCPAATSLEGGYFSWAGEYYQEAKVDDITVTIGLCDGVDIQQPGDNPEEPDLILCLGIESLKKLRIVLQQAEKIIAKRELVT